MFIKKNGTNFLGRQSYNNYTYRQNIVDEYRAIRHKSQSNIPKTCTTARLSIFLQKNQYSMAITDEQLRLTGSESEALAIYNEVKQAGDFRGFAQRFMHNADYRVARIALWTLTKATDDELAQLNDILNEFIDLAMQTDNPSVRRLSLNIIERLKMDEDDLRTDFLDFCMAKMTDVGEFSAIQAVSMKLAYRMCRFYPELMDELTRILDTMETGFYKPAVISTRRRILNGKLKLK